MTTSSVDRLDGVRTAQAIKTPCRAATTANIVLSGLQTVDGVALAAEDRVLVKDQTDTTENGIYCAATGAWARATDFNSTNEIAEGTQVLVNTGGTSNGGVIFAVSTADPQIGSALAFSAIQSSEGAFGSLLSASATQDAALTTLGFSTFFKTLIGATSALALNALLGLYKTAVATGSFIIPSGTSAQEVLSGASEAVTRWNTDNNELEVSYNGDPFGPASPGNSQFRGNDNSGALIGVSPGDIFRVHSQQLTEDVTIAATENAMASGPLDIAVSTTLRVEGNLSIV